MVFGLFEKPKQTFEQVEYSRLYGSDFIPVNDWVFEYDEKDLQNQVNKSLIHMVNAMHPAPRIGIHPLDVRLDEAFFFFKISGMDWKRMKSKSQPGKEVLFKKDEIKAPIAGLNSASRWHKYSFDKYLYSTYFHSLRVGLDSIKLSDFLGFDYYWKLTFFTAAINHDCGKFGRVFNLRNGDKSYPEYRKYMREHPQAALFWLRDFEPVVGSTVERHHLYEDDPYPERCETKETPEALLLSKYLSILDSHDAASTRENDRVSAISKRRLPSKKEVKESLLKSRGWIDLSYMGKHLPQTKLNGADLIEILYEANVLGRENPFNPYPDQFSFLYKQRTPVEIRMANCGEEELLVT